MALADAEQSRARPVVREPREVTDRGDGVINTGGYCDPLPTAERKAVERRAQMGVALARTGQDPLRAENLANHRGAWILPDGIFKIHDGLDERDKVEIALKETEKRAVPTAKACTQNGKFRAPTRS